MSLKNINGHDCLVFHFVDNTKQRTIENLETSNEFKEKAMSTISHELRNPLNISLGLLEEALEQTEIEPRLKSRLLLPAYKANQYLVNILQDMLDSAKLKDDELELNLERKSVVNTIKRVMNIFKY